MKRGRRAKGGVRGGRGEVVRWRCQSCSHTLPQCLLFYARCLLVFIWFSSMCLSFYPDYYIFSSLSPFSIRLSRSSLPSPPRFISYPLFQWLFNPPFLCCAAVFLSLSLSLPSPRPLLPFSPFCFPSPPLFRLLSLPNVFFVCSLCPFICLLSPSLWVVFLSLVPLV